MSKLSIENLNQSYGESQVLWDVTFEVPERTCTCLLGRNGVGKTTLLKTLMGLVPTDSGSIRVENVELTRKRAEARPKLGVAYVPQGREIFPRLSVEENLRIGLPARRDGQRHVPEHIYELFPVLRDMRHRRGGDLSGGQQQQLAIGRALVTDPKVLLLDEPTEGIQPNIVDEIGDLISHLLADHGLTVLLIEQKLPFARRVGERFCIMDKGRTVTSGPMGELTDELVYRHLVV